MMAAILLLGVVIGLLVALIVLFLVRKNETVIQKTLDGPLFMPKEIAYIAGLSDEESRFRESLPLDKQVEIL